MNKRQKKKCANLTKITYMSGYMDGFEAARRMLAAAKQLSQTAKALMELEVATRRKEDHKDDDMDKNRPVG